jgi:hypothetical protein
MGNRHEDVRRANRKRANWAGSRLWEVAVSKRTLTEGARKAHPSGKFKHPANLPYLNADEIA